MSDHLPADPRVTRRGFIACITGAALLPFIPKAVERVVTQAGFSFGDTDYRCVLQIQYKAMTDDQLSFYQHLFENVAETMQRDGYEYWDPNEGLVRVEGYGNG